MLLNLIYYFTFLPKIIAGIVLIYIIFKVLFSFYQNVVRTEEGITLKNIYNFIDPYKQSVFFYKYNFILILLLLGLIWLLYYLYVPAPMIEGGKYPKDTILINSITYLPNYLIHEFSHRFFYIFKLDWWTWACGSFVEILFPCIVYLFSLQLRGAQLFTPILFYWIAAALYDTGIYASDAVACKLALTSSDMVSNFKAGEMKGDWYYILKPLGLLDYAEQIGLALEILACVFFAFAIYSVINYFIKLSRDPRLDNNN